MPVTDISEHLPVFHVVYNSNITDTAKDKYITKRIITAERILPFKEYITNQNWDNILGLNNTQTAYNTYSATFIKIYNQCFPIRTIKITHSNRLPWLKQGMQRSRKNKNKLYYTQNTTQLNEKKYKNSETNYFVLQRNNTPRTV